MEWERIYLRIDVKIEDPSNEYSDVPLSFYAVNGLNQAKAVYQTEKIGADLYRLSANITNCGSNRCFPLGNYRICVCAGTEQVATVMASADVVRRINDSSRIFLYRGGKSTYNVFFYVAEGEDDLPLIMFVSSYSASSMNFPSNKPLRLPNPMRQIRKKLNGIRRPFLRDFYKICSFLYRNRTKTVLFMSEQNDSCGANQMAVYNRMKERGLDKEYTLLISARRAASQPQSRLSWLRLIRKIAMSQMVILDDHAPIFDWLKLNKRTTLVQLWHAGAGFKSSGYSRWGHFGRTGPAHRNAENGRVSGRRTPQ